MTSIYDMIKHVKGYGSVQADPVIVDAVRESTKQFLEESDWRRRALGPSNITLGYPWYSITADTDEEVYRVLSLSLSGTQLVPRTTDPIGTVTGTPKAFVEKAGGLFRLVPSPTASVTNGLTGVASMTIADNATTIPDEVYDRWRMPISAGAAASLGRAFEDKNRTDLDAIFNAGVARARLEVIVA